MDYDAPGHSCTTMAYSADGKRLVYQSILIVLQPSPIFWATGKFNLYFELNAGYFRVGQAKMESLMLLNGMKMMV